MAQGAPFGHVGTHYPARACHELQDPRRDAVCFLPCIALLTVQCEALQCLPIDKELHIHSHSLWPPFMSSSSCICHKSAYEGAELTEQYARTEANIHQHARAQSRVFDATDLYRSFGMMGTFSKRDFGSKPSVKKATPISAAMVLTCVLDSTCQESSMLAD